MKEYTINILEEIGANNAVSVEDGEKIYNRISELFDKGVKIKLDFNGISMLITAFLNSAIGKLYGKYDKNGFIKEHLEIINLRDEYKSTLKRVIEVARIYYKNKETIEENIKEVINEKHS